MTIISILIFIFVFVLGAITGAISNVTSGGAGVLTTYVLVQYGNLTFQQSVGTVLAASAIIVLVGGIEFYRKKLVDSQLAITVGLSGVVAAFLAARESAVIRSVELEHAFGAFTLIVAAFTAFRVARARKKKFGSYFAIGRNKSTASPIVRGLPDGGAPNALDYRMANSMEESTRWRGKDPLAITVQCAFGVTIGIITGLFGVGGAGLTMVVLLSVFKLKSNLLLGTSLMASFFRYAGGALGDLSTGLINTEFFILLVAGGAIGSVIGARFVIKRTKDIYVRLIIIGLLLFVSYHFLTAH